MWAIDWMLLGAVLNHACWTNYLVIGLLGQTHVKIMGCVYRMSYGHTKITCHPVGPLGLPRWDCQCGWASFFHFTFFFCLFFFFLVLFTDKGLGWMTPPTSWCLANRNIYSIIIIKPGKHKVSEKFGTMEG